MQAPTVVRSPDAQRDLRMLAAWISGESGRARAREVLLRLDRTISRLAARPLIGRRRIDFQGEPYSFSIPPWLIVYDPLPDGAGIHVLRILDTRRDLAALLGKKS